MTVIITKNKCWKEGYSEAIKDVEEIYKSNWENGIILTPREFEDKLKELGEKE